MERRSALKGIGGLLLAPSLALAATPINNRPAMRIAHITDVHLKNKFGAPAKFAKCLQHIQQQQPKVDFILNGGDIVFDMNKENLSDINDQWSLMKSVMKSECSVPVHYCLGNHDVW
jgi:Icc protein